MTPRQNALAAIRELLADLQVASPEWETLSKAEYLIMESMNDTRKFASDLYQQMSDDIMMGHNRAESRSNAMNQIDAAVKKTAEIVLEKMLWSNGGYGWPEAYRRLMGTYTSRMIAHACTGYTF